MGVALAFSGGSTAESGSITLTSKQVARVRFTSFVGSAWAWMKITRGSDISKVRVTDKEVFIGPALNGDTVTITYDGQGNSASAVLGVLEAIDV
jgi:hypothetical protein